MMSTAEKKPYKRGILLSSICMATMMWPSAVFAQASSPQDVDEGASSNDIVVTATRRDLARQPLTVAELAAFAAVVLDPPHAGAAEQAALLARSQVPVVVYVSCNPVALSRDARAFALAGWHVAAATPIDQFVHSAQLEAVVAFTRPATPQRGSIREG
jgi:23S rRNA (uracil1939-C5)-methyltransferase